ncbi:hypothetical protein ANCCEY_10103 [Ancylostoma ceylanicum]|uniref:RNA-directed DNA polymerase n=1 Tax=Ancylostoma ceylanicum TaxID=53326 RepID=A0A0D6LFS6_9BILA|nr:hypothetical protein ANCCEY_10103 [Ancylostoma ceylanicum]
MDEQGAVLAKLMEKMSSATPALNAGAPIVVRDRHAIFDSLRRRIEKFVYDPDRGRTFDIWLKRRVVAALKKDDHPHLDVTINGHPIQLLLDTGAGVTIVSESKWKLLGKPLRQKIHDTGFAANGTPLKIRGCFDADFAMAAPIVGVNKSNGTLHLCADSSTGLDDALMLHQHPLPTPDDVFTKLNGGTVFTQLDIADAYLQVEVDENSKELLTINTHRGLFRYDRLPFGVKSAPGIFQQIIDSMIAGLGGCAAYFDDVIVTGRLESLIIDAKGGHPDPAKLEVVKKMPPAKDIGQVRSLLGLLNHYGAFVEEMRQLRAPLDNLLKKDTLFNWTADSQQAFNRAKEVLSSDLLLTHFDPTKEIVVAADAW